MCGFSFTNLNTKVNLLNSKKKKKTPPRTLNRFALNM